MKCTPPRSALGVLGTFLNPPVFFTVVGMWVRLHLDVRQRRDQFRSD